MAFFLQWAAAPSSRVGRRYVNLAVGWLTLFETIFDETYADRILLAVECQCPQERRDIARSIRINHNLREFHEIRIVPLYFRSRIDDIFRAREEREKIAAGRDAL